MATRIIDPNRFILDAAVIDWTRIGRLRNKPAQEIANKRGVGPRVVQLRWILDPHLGMPTRAFQVWQRRHGGGATGPTAVLNVDSYQAFFAWPVYAWSTPLVFVQGTATVTGMSAVIAVYAGAPYYSALVGFTSLPGGTQTFSFSGPSILSLVVMGQATVANLVGIDGHNAATDPAWQLVEEVGLPVDPGDWAGVFEWPKDQGLAGAPLKPVDAARDRYRRGAPFFGWDDLIEAGRPAPAWVEADPNAIIHSAQTDMLGDLRTMIATVAPDEQFKFVVNHDLALAGGGRPAKTSFAPISTLILGIISDPLASLIMGFGTAYTDVPNPDNPAGGTASPSDFMVTAFYEKGPNGASPAEEYAAIVCAPGMPPPPLSPANLGTTLDGLAAPDLPDQRWRALARISWDLLQQNTPLRIGSYAEARYGIAPNTGPVALMSKRQFDPGGALQPISATTSAIVTASTGQVHAADETYLVDPAATPNIVRYAIAQQDLFGVWSRWSIADVDPAEPPVEEARLISARLDTVVPPPVPPTSLCQANLTVDLSWDWAARRPNLLRLVGRLYPITKPGLPPADLSIPAGLATAFPGGAGMPFTISFAGGNAGNVPGGAAVAYVSQDGTQLQAAPVIVAGPRRYRVTISNLQLDFASTGHIGIALWAQAQEFLPPQRTGTFSSEPLVASASDPRPPATTVVHEDVQLTSLADARGEYRARLNWSPMPGAVSYFVYYATESQFRIAAGLGESPSGRTTSDRLLDLRNAFEANPRREPFTRLNSTAQTDTDREVVIERGSKEIHLYVVVGVSAGNIETAWPCLADPDRRKRFQAFAAPQVVPPSPPVLEIARATVGSGGALSYRARISVATRPGARVTRVDLYRVRVPEAALNLDTMGPPIARIAATDAVWTVTPGSGPNAGQAIGTITGLDMPGGSWKRVYYRAVAISGDDLARAILGGRSPPTGAAWVVVPPDTPPDLSAIAADWPSGPLEAVRFTFSTQAPIADTDLGAHRLRVEAYTVSPDGLLTALFDWPTPGGATPPDDRLSAVPATPMPAPGLWREAAGATTNFRLLLTRPALDDTVRVRVQLTDPLGRVAEATLDSPGGSPLPTPDIVMPQSAAVGGGFILSFTTHALFTATAAGPYQLSVSATARPPVFPPRPPVRVSAALPSIAALRVLTDPFSDPAPIPLRHQGNRILVYLRASAVVALTLASPDGRLAQATVGVP
jgi:hypothetical protein